MKSEDSDVDRLELIVQLIAHIDRRLAGWTMSRFEQDADEVDLTAFRLAHVGENTQKLSREVRERYPELPWRKMADMRNLVAHEYGRIAPDRVWRTATQHLGELKSVCMAELARLSP